MSQNIYTNRAWQEARTLEQYGKNNKGEATLTLQEHSDGKTRVVFNPEVFGLTFEEFKEAFSKLEKHQSYRDFKDKFVTTPTYFKENNKSVPDGVFHNFLDVKKTFEQSNVWLPNSPIAMFSTLSKGLAFYNFLSINIPNATAAFREELGEVAEKIANVLPIKQQFEAPTLSEVQLKIENMQKAQPTQPHLSTGRKNNI